MAFTVAPTSGVEPYTLSATFISKSLIDGVNYNISVRTTRTEGYCPSAGVSTSLTPPQISTLLDTGSVSVNMATASGSCRTFTLQIIRLSDGEVFASSNAYVDNLL